MCVCVCVELFKKGETLDLKMKIKTSLLDNSMSSSTTTAAGTTTNATKKTISLSEWERRLKEVKVDKQFVSHLFDFFTFRLLLLPILMHKKWKYSTRIEYLPLCDLPQPVETSIASS